MSLDKTSEAIAHFVGLFDMAVEEARLRKEYDQFKSESAENEEADPYAFGPVRLKAAMDPDGYDPHLRYIPKHDGPVPQPIPQIPETTMLIAPYPDVNVVAPPQQSGPVFPDQGGFTLLPYVPIPSSVATVTFQAIHLHDDDLLGDAALAGFAPVELFHTALHQVIDLAEALRPWQQDSLVSDVLTDSAAAIDFIAVLDAVTAPPLDGLSVTILADEATASIVVNGTVVEEIPDIEDQLPTFIQAKRGLLDEETEDASDLAGHGKDPWDALNRPVHDQTDILFEPTKFSDHSVSAGANETHNHAAIATSWIDAGVIAVAGNVTNVNAVSQINILSDQNYVNGFAQSGGQAASQAYNIASIAASERPAEEVIEDIEPGSAPLGNGFPSVWNLERFEGDVTVANVVKQHTFATDNDRLDLTFSAQSTLIVSGENQMVNMVDIGEFGGGYDLIIVGGSMVSMNVISQVNVLLDDDYFLGEGLGQAIVSDGDNLLRNEARITEEGTDTIVDMMQEFQTAIHDLAQGAADLAREVAQSEYFKGMEALRALYIEGDLTQINVVDQVNYLGDQDQIHMARDAMLAAMSEQLVTITTGSNLMTNTAEIVETGYDSDVMAGGNYYNEALLYQAELIDTDADPLGVSMTSLASEAVAFLADGLVHDLGQDLFDGAGYGIDAHTGGTALDVMQTMTA